MKKKKNVGWWAAKVEGGNVEVLEPLRQIYRRKGQYITKASSLSNILTQAWL